MTSVIIYISYAMHPIQKVKTSKWSFLKGFLNFCFCDEKKYMKIYDDISRMSTDFWIGENLLGSSGIDNLQFNVQWE